MLSMRNQSQTQQKKSQRVYIFMTRYFSNLEQGNFPPFRNNLQHNLHFNIGGHVIQLLHNNPGTLT